MTRREFIERAAIAGFGADEVAILGDAIRLADEVEKRAGGDWSPDPVATLADKLHEIDRSLELIAAELPNASRGS